MKRTQASRGLCDQKTEPSSTETFTGFIQSGGLTPADPISTEGSIGSIGTEETDLNKVREREVGSSISLIDPQNTSYFIQYHPELADKFSNLKSNTYSVSGRCLSIVFSRMLYWSKYARHRHKGKLFYWKNQTELSRETGFSIKQINRALKILVEMGMIIREKIMKHRYFQCYFYHIPVSPFTKEIPPRPNQTTGSTRTTSRRNTSSGSTVPQRFHSNTDPRSSRSIQQEHSQTSPTAGVPPTGGSGAPCASLRSSTSLGAVVPPRRISGGIGFGKKDGKCPIHSTTTSTLIKHSLKSIVDRCNFIGKYGIKS
jgi:hypothetical protein